MSDVTQLLHSVDRGDSNAAEDLLPAVYDELCRLAAQQFASERPGQTLQATALVHEAYLRLVNQEQVQTWNSRGHFYSAAAEAMRRILVENARRKKRLRHGGDRVRVNLELAEPGTEQPSDDLLALDEALTQLAEEDTAKAELVKLRYFAGMTLEEIAAFQNISLATAKRRWAFARAWLYQFIQSM